PFIIHGLILIVPSIRDHLSILVEFRKATMSLVLLIMADRFDFTIRMPTRIHTLLALTQQAVHMRLTALDASRCIEICRSDDIRFFSGLNAKVLYLEQIAFLIDCHVP